MKPKFTLTALNPHATEPLPTPEKEKDVRQFRPYHGTSSRAFDVDRIASQETIETQTVTPVARATDGDNQSGEAPAGVPDAPRQHRYQRLLEFCQINQRTQTIIEYVFLFAVTSLALVTAYVLPHPPVWQSSWLLWGTILLTVFSSPVTVKMLLFLLIAPWYDIWITLHQKPTDPTYTPRVSIILPAWNEGKGIVATVKTLLASSYHNIQIIVVNDGSTDTSDQEMNLFLAKYKKEMHGIFPVPIIYYYQENAGKAAALNAGIDLANGEIIVCGDADCAFDKDCIRAFVKTMRDTTIMACCGNVKVGNPHTLLSHIQVFEYAASFYARQADGLLNTLYVVSGAAGAYRREVFDTVGRYGTALRGGGEDVDLSIRVQQAGYKIAYCQDAVVYTEVPTTFSALAKQRKRWTFSRFMTFKRYKTMIFSRQKQHNKILTWLVMPLIIFNDWLYIVKMILKIGLYITVVVTGSYQILVMLIVLSMVISAIPLFQDRRYRVYLWLTPVCWLLSFVSAFIEMYASGIAIFLMLNKREVTWAAQQRQGVLTKSGKE